VVSLGEHRLTLRVRRRAGRLPTSNWLREIDPRHPLHAHEVLSRGMLRASLTLGPDQAADD
jgi:hypothetical protein